MHKLEVAASVGPLLKDVRAGDVHRHQVGRELDATEPQRHRLGHLADQQGLGQSRHAHQQGVPAGEEANRQPFDHLVMPDDHPPKLLPQPFVHVAQLVDGLDVVVVELLLD